MEEQTVDIPSPSTILLASVLAMAPPACNGSPDSPPRPLPQPTEHGTVSRDAHPARLLLLQQPPSTGEPAALAVWRAGQWLNDFPLEQLRFDAAIGLYAIRRMVDSPALEGAWNKAREKAREDDDNPMRRFWDQSAQAPIQAILGWTAPRAAPDSRRVNVNRVVGEALFCDRYGFREQSWDYLTGPMRDQGGYHSTHALWALDLLQARGCREGSALTMAGQDISTEILAVL